MRTKAPSSAWRPLEEVAVDHDGSRAQLYWPGSGKDSSAVAEPTAHMTLPVSEWGTSEDLWDLGGYFNQIARQRNRFDSGRRRMRSGGFDADRVDGADGLSDKCRCAPLFQWKRAGRTWLTNPCMSPVCICATPRAGDYNFASVRRAFGAAGYV